MPIFPARERLTRALAIAAAALMLCWPAIWSGYPLLDNDTIPYLDGHHVLRMIFRRVAYAPHWIHSEIYSSGIWLLHLNLSPWPVIAANALATAWVLWLVVRSLSLRRPMAVYLGLIAALSLLSTVAWYVSLLMTDIYGVVLYLCLYLLVFLPDRLRRWETIVLAALAWWGMTVNTAHLLLGGLLCLFLGFTGLLRWPPMRLRGRALLRASGVVLFAAASLLGLHAWLYGRPSLAGYDQPPLLMARVIADGPGARYLQQNCANLHWTICSHVNNLPTISDNFLWAPGQVWMTSTPEQQDELRREEMPLVIATWRAFPLQEAAACWRSFTDQLTLIGPDDNGPTPWIRDHLDAAFKGATTKYLRSRFATYRLRKGLFTAIQEIVVLASAAFILAMLEWLWRARHSALLGLTAIVVFITFANAVIAADLSCVARRYEGRVIWLVALLAAMLGCVRWYSADSQDITPAGKLGEVPE